MNSWRYIVSLPSTGAQNMALDEALFTLADKKPVIRVYSWKAPCITIGYFQKFSEFASSSLPVTRRLTGGLAVSHKNDLSYCFAASADDWPFVYNQPQSYRVIHSGIKHALDSLGIKTEFYDKPDSTQKNPYCTQTFFNYDLHVMGTKVLGSSQRRSKKLLLQQGSIHLPEKYDFGKAANALKNELETSINYSLEHKVSLDPSEPSSEELLLKESLIKSKYASDDWNEKT